MSLNITPKSVLKGTNSDGSKFTLEDWDFGTYANLHIASLIVIFIGCVFLCSIAPLILLIISALSISGRIQVTNLIGIVISTYFLIDCYNGWFGSATLNLVCDESAMKFMIGLNIACLLTHIILLLISKSLVTNGNSPIVNLVVMIGILVMTYQFIGELFAPKLGERVLFIYHSKYNSMEERDAHDAYIKSLESKTNEQIEEDANNEYYNRRIANDGWTKEQVNEDKKHQKDVDKEAQKHYW